MESSHPPIPIDQQCLVALFVLSVYLDTLNGAYMLRILTPWYENLKKRQVKSPKIYVRDSGLLHALLEIDTGDALSGHPKIGASFEGFSIEQILAHLDTSSAGFWATHAGAELDLLVTIAGVRYGFECKYADAPGTTRSMRVAINNLQLEHLWVVYPGNEAYELDDDISVVPVDNTLGLVDTLIARRFVSLDAPDRIDSDRLRTIFGATHRYRCAITPKSLAPSLGLSVEPVTFGCGGRPGVSV